MDVVIQFAVHKLGFQLSDIIVYAWSIGGFTGKKKKNPTATNQPITDQKTQQKKKCICFNSCIALF